MSHILEYAKQFIDTPESYASLTQISSMLGGTKQFDMKAKDYGLPDFAFIHLEILMWEAMSVRSGAITYYEVLNADRQEHTQTVLRLMKQDELLEVYSMGIGKHENDEVMDKVDDWIKNNESEIIAFIANNVRANRDELLNLFA